MTNEKVDKLISETTLFMENFQTTFDSNTKNDNESMQILRSLFKIEKAKLQEINTGLQSDHEAFQTCISSQISHLQKELPMESKIMDSLAIKTERVKFSLLNSTTLRNRFKFCSLRAL
ncbi:unnamed protein product [Lactuca saligna]|uniref:Uncharacterized protein n=1 Tax=Lactuca saligna TaxID=75948 RepID=A0AA36E6F0_LACSI|nr:unnamed protein product [Lactuca saligna]